MSRARVLHILQTRGPCTYRQLAAAAEADGVVLSASSITILVRKGWVEIARKTSAGAVYRLTPAGVTAAPVMLSKRSTQADNAPQINTGKALGTIYHDVTINAAASATARFARRNGGAALVVSPAGDAHCYVPGTIAAELAVRDWTCFVGTFVPEREQPLKALAEHIAGDLQHHLSITPIQRAPARIQQGVPQS